MPLPRVVAPLLVALLTLAACSQTGGEVGSAPVTEAPAPEAPAPAPEAPEAGPDEPADDAQADEADEPAEREPDEPLGEIVGQVDVAGTTYDILEVRRCEPLQMEMLDRDLEVQGFGVHGGERVQIDVYVQKVAGQQLDEVSWAGPEGIFGGPEDAAVTFDGSVVRGSATVRDALTQEQTLPVTFELEVPDEIVQCR